jgi:hypothetical protein
MLRGAKGSKIEVLVPKEEEEVGSTTVSANILRE